MIGSEGKEFKITANRKRKKEKEKKKKLLTKNEKEEWMDG